MSQVDYDDIYGTFESFGLDHIDSDDLVGDEELLRLFNEYQNVDLLVERAADCFLSYIRERLSEDYY